MSLIYIKISCFILVITSYNLLTNYLFLLLFANTPAIEAIPIPINPNIPTSPVCGLDGLLVFELSPLFELFPPWLVSSSESSPSWFPSPSSSLSSS